MDGLLHNVFIDIAIAFVLTYALLALLVMKVQESWHGNLMSGRVHNLHRLLQETLMGDKELVKQLLKNPLLFALYTAPEPRAGFMIVPARGPSEIPPDLFARALVMELNPSGKPPGEDHATPTDFVDALDRSAAPDSARGKLVRALRGLLPGNEGNWASFEAAIASWFCAAGDRSKGWWKRRSSMVGFWIAVIFCALLNVDAGRIAKALAEDRELRGALVNIADSVQDVQSRDARTAAPATSASAAAGTVAVIVDPETRAVSRLVDAISRLRTAFGRDQAIKTYGFYASDIAKVCGEPIKEQVLPNRKGVPEDDEGRYLSNADTWQAVLPVILARIENAVQGVGEVDAKGKSTEPAEELRRAQRCLVEVSAWVRAATDVGSQADTKRLMREAAVALEDSKAAMNLLIRAAESGDARRLFSADPDTYADCSRGLPPTFAALERCVRNRQNAISRLPIGMSVANRNAQFCVVKVPCTDAQMRFEALNSPLAAGAPEVPTIPACTPDPASSMAWLCDGESAPIPQLGLPAFKMQFAGWMSFGVWIGGVLISAFFVSLGAPFWFDLLSRVMRVRASSLARQDGAAVERGQGARPLPISPTPAAAPPSARLGGSAGERSTLPRVVGAGNAFEDDLIVREVQALQQALGVKATGELDSDTRAAIAIATRERGLGETQFLTATTYATLVGRPASQTRNASAAQPSGRLRRGEPNPLVPLLVQHLQARMGKFNRTIDPNATTLDDELRALCVLWRFKTDATTPIRNRDVFGMARANPKQFDEVDQTLLQKIADPAAPATLAREAQPWMDWALGELGQVEAPGSSRATSNPRVCDYLDAISSTLGDKGDVTPWCGAFVTWVLKNHLAKDVAPAATLQPPTTPEGAKNWINWPPGAASTAAAPNPGDVVVINVQGSHHVGFALETDTAAGLIWLVGGNQNKGTCVCLSRFPLTDVAWAARPV